jgi:hypothetical protein
MGLNSGRRGHVRSARRLPRIPTQEVQQDTSKVTEEPDARAAEAERYGRSTIFRIMRLSDRNAAHAARLRERAVRMVHETIEQWGAFPAP